ncbi:kinesin-related protein 4 [Hylaeus volcanicus]|uniref:kinesin-related protein 4 n=1 Tax=Hylaeus volcanicus TaxID=313075 RepID=UPI0023B79B83|nr:kinesin-related protein 4 [Hylaeus volcanicus]
MSDSIKVAIRVRPLIKREKEENQTIQWVVQGNCIVPTDPEMKKRGDGGFCFDHIFDTDATNMDVFNTIVKPIVDAAVNGINGTVFAYGQTSSGKTYSMLGTSQELGIVPLAIDYMFDAIGNTIGREFLLRVSYLELYNERVNDLLNKNNTDLKLKEDGNGQIVLQCKEEITNCPESVISLMKKGDKIRRIGETNMNERSSRSHTIFRITIESREAEGDSDGAIQVSQLNLVDLAGSERARQTGATGERFKEGRHINMSLSTLGLVIMQLSESQDSQKHVNFRDSKLTRLLQSSLGGNAMTAILCAVTPAALEETQCTLSFACRAKSVKNKPEINEVMSDAALLKRYAKQLSKLQAELQRIKTENRVAEVKEMESKLQEKERVNQLLEERIELLKTRIVSGDTTNQESFKYKSKRRQTWGGPGLFNQHLPSFKPATELSPIKKMSCEKPHNRKSIIQSADIINQTFQTAFTDFELELFESERARESRGDVTDSDDESFVTKRNRRVTFMDDVLIARSKDSITPEKINLNITPEKCDTATQTLSYEVSPSTPKHILRQCIEDLGKEYAELRQFTVMEKQLICQENNNYCTHNKEPLQSKKLKFDSEVATADTTESVKQSEDVTSKEDEFEQINAELKATLNQISAKLESEVISERAAKEEAIEKISKLEEFIQEIASERNKFKRMNDQLIAELNQKTANFESKFGNEQVTIKVTELEKKIEEVSNEKDELEHLNAELQSTVVLEQTERRKAIEKISELEKEIENITRSKCKLEHVNTELKSRITSDQDTNREAMAVISELDRQNRDNEERKEMEDTNCESCDEQNEILELEVKNDTEKDVENVIVDGKGDTIMLDTELKMSESKENVQLENQELNETKCNVESLEQDIETLRKTISLLKTENTEIAGKLATEQENAKRAELDLQKTIDELYSRISEVTVEKINLESNLEALNDELKSTRSRITETRSEEQIVATYQNKIDNLTAENIELSTTIVEKNNELKSIKETKSLLYDHECIYKEEVAVLAQKNECLELQNNELSTDLIDKIEENDVLKERCDILKSKIDQFQLMNENSVESSEDHLRSQNNMLKAEIAELKAKMTILSEENTKFSNNLLEAMEVFDRSTSEQLRDTSITFSDSIETANYIEQNIVQTENREVLAGIITTLQEKIGYLTRLNKKLSDLKLTSCSQCAHLRNLNESRRALKLEKKALTQKLEDLQGKLDRKCVDVERLKGIISRELNSSRHDVSANVSFVDEGNVSFVEERIRNLNDELQTLKANHDKLSILYEDKCNEFTEFQVQEKKTTDATSTESKERSSESRRRIEQIQNHIDRLRDNMDELKTKSVDFTVTLGELKNEKEMLLDEIDALKAANEELRREVSSNEIALIEKIRVLENELSNTSSEMEQFLAREKDLERKKLTLETELEELKAKEESKNTLVDQLNERIESLKNELDLVTSQKNSEIEQQASVRIKELEVRVDDLQLDKTKQECLYKEVQEKVFQIEKSLQDSEQAKCILTEKLQAVETELTDSKSKLESKHKDELESLPLQYEHRIEEFESNFKTLKDTLNEHVNKNLELTSELSRLRDIEEKCNATIIDNEKLNESLNDIRKCMTKELRSLKCNRTSEDLSGKSVNEIFVILLQTFVSKEEDMIKTIRERFEKDKQKLVDEKQQSADTEKRATIWAKELEAEIEKLQNELTERERVHKEYENNISQLEHLLRESNHENEVLKSNVKVLEADLNNWQMEFEKRYKVDNRQEEDLFIAHKKEKETQETFKNKEMELESKIESEKEICEKKISDLEYTIESYKTKNLELNSTVEGLEANEKQLQNIIEANSIEIKRNNQNIERVNLELEQLREAYNEMSQKVEKKDSHIEEIAKVLKKKCDELSEYKTKLETIMPECETLKEKIEKQKSSIERYKGETEALLAEREAQLEIIKDKLNSEEIKNAGLVKQLNELNNKNVVLIEKLNELKEKYEELRQENAKLERKGRNSTSKMEMEAKIEELKETNGRLLNNLEGASNRVTELQEIKNQTLKEVADLKGKVEVLMKENSELKTTLSKNSSLSSLIDESKYNALLLEKNSIVSELEIKEYARQVQQLTDKNKELDDELEEYAGIIRERDDEISKLENKLYSRLTENVHINELTEKIRCLNEVNEKLRDQIDGFKMKLEMDVRDVETTQVKDIIDKLKSENLELLARLNDYKKREENAKRKFEILTSNKNLYDYEEKCLQLKKKIHELELELVSKNGKIATLEIQIQSESFPYQKKCKELEEHLLAFRTKNAYLNSEIRKLQRTLNDVNTWECEVCRRWRLNRNDQACQTLPNDSIRFCSTGSGIVEDHIKIQKLEKEKALMKALCRSRCQRIRELEDKIKELEST